MTRSGHATSDQNRALQSWASGALATDFITGFAGPWELKLSRRTVVRFPGPADIETAAEATFWERQAQAVAAECTTRGQTAAWIVPGLTATVLGAAAVAGTNAVHESLPWAVALLASALSTMVLTSVGLLIAASIALPIVRDLHMSAPTWTARAQAYARRREGLETAADSATKQRWRRARARRSGLNAVQPWASTRISQAK